MATFVVEENWFVGIVDGFLAEEGRTVDIGGMWVHRRQAFPLGELRDEELTREREERVADTCTADEVTARK